MVDDDGLSYVGSPPLVTIIIPSFNSSKTIEDTIASVLEQTYRPIEIVVVVDSGEDNTIDLIESVRSQRSEEIFVIVNESRRGVAESRNIGLNRARGEYVLFLDSDDQLRIDALEEMVRAITESDYDFCFSGYSEHHNNGNIKTVTKDDYDQESVLIDYLRGTVSIPNLGCVLISRPFLNKFDIRFFEGCSNAEDSELKIKVFSVGRGRYLNKDLLRFYVSDASLSHKFNFMAIHDGNDAYLRGLNFINEHVADVRVVEESNRLVFHRVLPIRVAQFGYLAATERIRGSTRKRMVGLELKAISDFNGASMKDDLIFYAYVFCDWFRPFFYFFNSARRNVLRV
jgi:glycosyltransferase involved in cell wall biosynthesis